MSIWLAPILILLGGLLVLVHFTRRPTRSPFAPPTIKRRGGAYRRLRMRLRRAGLVETSPSTFLGVLLIVGLLGSLGVFTLAANIYITLVFPLLLGGGTYIYLSWRERTYMQRAALELVPFLRRVESQVRAGRNAQAAFLDGLEETRLLRVSLERTITELRLNRPFQDVLEESVEDLPIRAWRQFVRQITIHASSGGDLAEVLRDAAEQINDTLTLQAELRADFGRIALQQWILIVIAVAAVPAMKFLMGGLIDPLFQSLVGWVLFGISILLMVAGIIYGQTQVRQIERKLDL